MANKHAAHDLAQMQSLPLEAKIMMTKQRIKAWHDSWVRFEIYNEKTKKTRFVTYAVNNPITDEPPMTEDEYILTAISGAVYVGFSGGIDSTVLKHIVDSMYPDVPSVFVNTGLEYPEIQQFVREIKRGKYDCFNPDVEIVRPKMRFDEVIKKYGYPVFSKEIANNIEYGRKAIARGDEEKILRFLYGVRKKKTGEQYSFGKLSEKALDFALNSNIPVSSSCCRVMKKAPSKEYEKKTGRVPILGTQANESNLRYQAWLSNGCNAFESKRPSSQPLSFWTKQDILHYIKKYNVPYCPVYGDIVIGSAENITDQNGVTYQQVNLIDYIGEYEETDILKTTGCDRTGCIFCMFGCHLEKEPNRFQKLKKTHPKQYEYCINGGEMVDGKWQPSKDGLGIGKVLDYIGVDYE